MSAERTCFISGIGLLMDTFGWVGVAADVELDILSVPLTGREKR